MRWCVIVLMTLSLAGAASASPPPPPPPDWADNVVPRSCGDVHEPWWGEPASLRIFPLPASALGRGAQLGRLRYLGGFEVQSDDPRLAGIVSMQNHPNGLIALTRGGSWLLIDLHNSVIRGITVAPVADGPPLATFGTARDTYFASAQESGVVSRYALEVCGFRARGVPMFTAGDGRIDLIADYVGGYTAFAGHDASGRRGERTRYAPSLRPAPGDPPVELSDHDLPDVQGYRLAGLAPTAHIVPQGLVALWRPTDSRSESVFEFLSIPQWSDVRGPDDHTIRIPLGRVPAALGSVVGWITLDPLVVYFMAATDAAPGEPTRFYLFSVIPRTGEI